VKTLAVALLLSWSAFAAEEGGHQAAAGHESAATETAGEEGGGHGGKSSETLFKIVNFVILAGALGYLIRKNAPAFFRARGDEIQRGIREASELRRDAEQRAAGIELRMSNLSGEVEQIRKEAAAEAARESERIQAETAQQLEKIGTKAQEEIASAAKAARHELKMFAAGLAIQLAAERIRSGMTPEAQDALIDGFVSDLQKSRSKPEVH
jgi:F-type H+-transporting ATPase subunit b